MAEEDVRAERNLNFLCLADTSLSPGLRGSYVSVAAKKAKGLKPNKVDCCLTKVNPGRSNPITAGNSVTDINLIVFLLLRLKDGRPALYRMIEVRRNLNDVRECTPQPESIC